METTGRVAVLIFELKLTTNLHTYIEIHISAVKNVFASDAWNPFCTELVHHVQHYINVKVKYTATVETKFPNENATLSITYSV